MHDIICSVTVLVPPPICWGHLPSPRSLGPLFSAVRSGQQQPTHTVIIAPKRIHGLTILCEFALIKRKRSEWDAQSPCNPTRQRYFESPYAQSPATREAAPLSTKRTPPTPCCQYCAERCSHACPTPSPSPPRKWRALSLNQPTPPKRSQQSTSRRLQNESPQTGCFRHDHSPSCRPLTKENPRALEPIPSLAEKASPAVYTRNPSPTCMESVRTHMKRLDHLRLGHTISRCACALREDTWDTW